MKIERITEPQWTYDADTFHIEIGGAPIARIFDIDDFPCFDPDTDEEYKRVEAEYASYGPRIILAVNVFPALVEALESVVSVDDLLVSSSQGFDARVLAYDDALGKARAALALAKGGTETAADDGEAPYTDDEVMDMIDPYGIVRAKAEDTAAKGGTNEHE